jgi:tetratricopeptide (TPR) repeat protein
VLLQLGLCEHRRGRLETALDWLARAREFDPHSSVIEFHRGEVLYHRGMNQEALTALERAVALNPENAEAHHLLAFVLGDLGRHEEARRFAKRAAQLNPALTRAQSNLSLEAPQEAREPAAPRASVPAQVQAVAHASLALAFRQKGYWAEALREYRLALELGEDRVAVRTGMAELHLLRHDLPAALALYDELVQERPAAKLWNERGVVLHQLGRLDEACASYRQGIAAARADAAACHNNLGVALVALGRLEEAVDGFRGALQRQGDLLQARLNLALLLTQLKRYQLALEAYRQALATAPDACAAWTGIGLVLVELGRHADAKNAFARAVEADPSHAPTRRPATCWPSSCRPRIRGAR